MVPLEEIVTEGASSSVPTGDQHAEQIEAISIFEKITRPGESVPVETKFKVERSEMSRWCLALHQENCIQLQELLRKHPMLLNVSITDEFKQEAQDSVSTYGERRPWQQRTALHVGAKRGSIVLLTQIMKLFDDIEWWNDYLAKDVFEELLPDFLFDLVWKKDDKYELNALEMATVNGNRDVIYLLSQFCRATCTGSFPLSAGKLSRLCVFDKSDECRRFYEPLRGKLTRIIQKVREEQEENFQKLREAYDQNPDFNSLVPFELYTFHFSSLRSVQELEGLTRLRACIVEKVIVDGGAVELAFLFGKLQDGKGRTAIEVAVDEDTLEGFRDLILPFANRHLLFPFRKHTWLDLSSHGFDRLDLFNLFVFLSCVGHNSMTDKHTFLYNKTDRFDRWYRFDREGYLKLEDVLNDVYEHDEIVCRNMMSCFLPAIKSIVMRLYRIFVSGIYIIFVGLYTILWCVSVIVWFVSVIVERVNHMIVHRLEDLGISIPYIDCELEPIDNPPSERHDYSPPRFSPFDAFNVHDGSRHTLLYRAIAVNSVASLETPPQKVDEHSTRTDKSDSLKSRDNLLQALLQDGGAVDESIAEAEVYTSWYYRQDWVLEIGVRMHRRNEFKRRRESGRPLLTIRSLHLAALMQDWVTVSSLLKDEKCLAEDDSRCGVTLLHLAAGAARYDILSLILGNRKYNHFVEDFEGNTPLHYALKGPELEWELDLMDYVSCEHALRSREAMRRRKRRAKLEIQSEYDTANRRGCVELLLNYGFEIWTSNKKQELPSPGPNAPDDFLIWWYDRRTKEISDSQRTFNAAANAISVTAALVATASYLGPFQPPGGFDGSQIRLGRALSKAYLLCQTLAFYLALASVMLALSVAIPLPQQSMTDELKGIRRQVILAVLCIFPSTICLLADFAVASILTVTEKQNEFPISTTVVGGIFCSLTACIFSVRLLRVVAYRHPRIRRFYEKALFM